ncbi:MAG: hypothetical protein KIT84_26375 [Labilithrix sp.]|nr:hypothetical protein [Labilithrix sp.]MCW5814582.1 hypothetical protein [Labilithrix sp.]
MTGSFVRAALADVQSRATTLATSLSERGFEVVRTKIEQHGRLDDVAVTPSPTSYFEYHAKLVLPSPNDPVIDVVHAHGGSLSANVANTPPLARGAGAKGTERFLTLRPFGLARAEADARFAALLAAIAACGVATRGRVREYTVLDTNPALDRGWIDAS